MLHPNLTYLAYFSFISISLLSDCADLQRERLSLLLTERMSYWLAGPPDRVATP